MHKTLTVSLSSAAIMASFLIGNEAVLTKQAQAFDFSCGINANCHAKSPKSNKFIRNTAGSIADAADGKLSVEGVINDRANVAAKEIRNRTKACMRKGLAGCANDIRTGIQDGVKVTGDAVECWGGSVRGCVQTGRWAADQLNVFDPARPQTRPGLRPHPTHTTRPGHGHPPYRGGGYASRPIPINPTHPGYYGPTNLGPALTGGMLSGGGGYGYGAGVPVSRPIPRPQPNYGYSGGHYHGGLMPIYHQNIAF